MIRFLGLLLFSLFVTNAAADDKSIEDTTQNRISEADRYLSVMPPKDTIIDIVKKMAVQIPVEKRQTFTDLMNKYLESVQFASIIRDSMVNHFTAEELQALANLCSSPIGRSAMKKYGHFMPDAMPEIQILMIEVFEKVQVEMNKN